MQRVQGALTAHAQHSSALKLFTQCRLHAWCSCALALRPVMIYTIRVPCLPSAFGHRQLCTSTKYTLAAVCPLQDVWLLALLRAAVMLALYLFTTPGSSIGSSSRRRHRQQLSGQPLGPPTVPNHEQVTRTGCS
jgi:hypothetical protein